MAKMRQLATMCVVIFVIALVPAAPATAATLTVTSTGDATDATAGDGICATTAGNCTLRAAIEEANALPGADTITFSIGTGGLQTIAPASVLPNVTGPTIIDGTTQPGYSSAPIIEIDASGVSTHSGLAVLAGNSTVRGLVINRAPNFGLVVTGSTLVQGNYIGTDASGSIARPNGGGGIHVSGTGNTIGGITAAARNVISGNGAQPCCIRHGIELRGTGHLIRGNYIGTNAAGTAALPNLGSGISFQVSGANATIGGTTPGAGNVLSGNRLRGIEFFAVSGNTVQGNLVGTNAAGTAAIGNGFGGIHIGHPSLPASSNLIGGTTPGARNVISGNGGGGLFLGGGTNNTVQGNLIGVAADGTTPLGNRDVGVAVDGTSDNLIGGTTAAAANVVAYNGHPFFGAQGGVRVSSGTGNRLLGNKIFSNMPLGIDLIGGDGNVFGPGGVTPNDPLDADTGPNNLQNYPVLESFDGPPSGAVLKGKLSSAPSTTYRLEFFGNSACDPSGHGEGETLFTTLNVSTDAAGEATFTIAPVASAAVKAISATATDPAGNTSEFSNCRAAKYVVDSSADGADSNVDDGACNDGTGKCTLRAAIQQANRTAERNEIRFAVATGPFTTSPTSPLPTITDPLIIDGTSQPGFAGTPIVEIDGLGAGSSARGLVLAAGSSTIRGLVVGRFGGDGLLLQGHGNTTIDGMYVGTDHTGTLDRGNGGAGVLLLNSSSNRIGGTSALKRNVISGNDGSGIELVGSSSFNIIEGNYVGTDVTGATALGNKLWGVFLGGSGSSVRGNAIGFGFAPTGVGNVVAGNGRDGIRLNGAGTVENFLGWNNIGTNAAGTAALANAGNGVLIDSGPTENVIGMFNAGNVISGNAKAGVQIDGGTTTMNAVHGNRIGTNGTATAALGNGVDGLFITGAPGNFAARNVIGGNSGSGVRIRLSGATGNFVALNQIGISGTLPIPNAGDGVTIDLSASDNSIRSGNVIANNAGRGVFIESGTGNAVRGNSIFVNGALGIDLAPSGPTPNDPGDGDAGPNGLQNFPSVSVQPGGTSVAGSLSSTPSTAFVIDIFDNVVCDASGFGEGEKYLGSVNVTTDGTGTATFTFTPGTAIPAGHFATATATDPSGNTSEFSVCGAKTADELTQDLVGQVQGLGLPTGTANSLVAKLQAALGSISAGDATTACNQLNAFINEVQAQSGKKIDASDATALIEAAENIKTDLGCP